MAGGLRRPHGILPRCVLLWCCCGLWATGPPAAAQLTPPGIGALPGVPKPELAPGLLVSNTVLAPKMPYHAQVPMGESKFLRFSCVGGPADAVITLSSYSVHADPLLFVSLDAHVAPSFQQHDASSFLQWREDSPGHHYVVVRNVGPSGGIAGLINMRHFANEELDAVMTIQCSFIIAFDFLFWDHIMSDTVCPVGEPAAHIAEHRGAKAPHDHHRGPSVAVFCSGRGKCDREGVCECFGDYTGAACESEKTDVVVAAHGQYDFQVATGSYRYFRVRIPARFAGGYLQVKVIAEQPLVILVSDDQLPTKSRFDMSNFGDWVMQHNETNLKFSVPSIFDGPQQSETAGQPPKAGPGSPQDFGGVCPNIAPTPTGSACGSVMVQGCEEQCMQCIACVPGKEDSKSRTIEDGACTRACDDCNSRKCLSELAQCAGEMSCQDPSVKVCEEKCGGCMSCIDSNDARCSDCGCCRGCLPVAAKCGLLTPESAETKRYVFVGLFNHRWYYNERHVVHAAANIALVADPSYEHQSQLPSTWIPYLYDHFLEIGRLELTQQEIFPTGDQFIYEISVSSDGEEMMKKVKLYRDRLTLLHVTTDSSNIGLELLFRSGPNITHVLSSSAAAPKTIFDFDQVHTQIVGSVKIKTRGHPFIWCALFGAVDGNVHVEIRPFADPSASLGSSFGFAIVCVFGLLCGLVVLGVVYSGAQRIGERLGPGEGGGSMPVSERFMHLVRGTSLHGNESTSSLTRGSSLAGYLGGEAQDREMEDRYLHRGGFGDDGI